VAANKLHNRLYLTLAVSWIGTEFKRPADAVVGVRAKKYAPIAALASFTPWSRIPKKTWLEMELAISLSKNSHKEIYLSIPLLFYSAWILNTKYALNYISFCVTKKWENCLRPIRTEYDRTSVQLGRGNLIGPVGDTHVVSKCAQYWRSG